MADHPTRARRGAGKLLTAVGIALLVGGVLVSWAASRRQGADYSTIHVTALAVLRGDPLYNLPWQRAEFPRCCDLQAPWGMFYPPATGVVALPFALLPYLVARSVWLAVMILLVVMGARAVVRLARPEAPPYVWMIAAGSLLLSACIRWGMTPLQGAPLVVGLLCYTVVSLQEGRPVRAFLIAAAATAFKITLALPFLGLLFLHRRYKMLAGAIGAWILFNAVGFARVGGMTAVAEYQENVRHVETIDNVNTPDAWSLISVPRTDWPYLLHGLGLPLDWARPVGLAAAALVGLWLLLQSRRIREEPDLATATAFLTPLVCLAMVSVYHHHYDVALFAVPLLAGAIGSNQLRRPPWAMWLTAPLVLVLALAPVGTMLRVAVETFGAGSRGLVTLMFPVAITMTLVGSLAVLWQVLAARPERFGLVSPSVDRAGPIAASDASTPNG